MNRWSGIGRFGKDPELAKTSTGKSVCNFSLAVEHGYQNEAETFWLDFVAWGSTAEFISKYFAKGDAIYIDGELQAKIYEGKDGKKHKGYKIAVEKAEFLPGGKQ